MVTLYQVNYICSSVYGSKIRLHNEQTVIVSNVQYFHCCCCCCCWELRLFIFVCGANELCGVLSSFSHFCCFSFYSSSSMHFFFRCFYCSKYFFQPLVDFMCLFVSFCFLHVGIPTAWRQLANVFRFYNRTEIRCNFFDSVGFLPNVCSFGFRFFFNFCFSSEYVFHVWITHLNDTFCLLHHIVYILRNRRTHC